MNLNTSLKGRLRNTNLPLTNVLHPLFEAVVNSIHSIDSAISVGQLASTLDGKIRIKVLRSPQTSIIDDSKPDIIGFELIDNGVGFNQDNYNSFQTLDSEYKIALGCRGVGRLLWLKAFKRVTVKSSYKFESKIYTRTFDFDVINDIHNETNELTADDAVIETSIRLLDIHKQYQKYLRKSSQTIARDLLEHCLWYFIRSGSAPDIFVEDGDDIISLHNEYEQLMINASEKTSFAIKERQFEITHVKLKSTLQHKHSIVYSAADRVVKEESLQGKIPGLFGYINDNDESFAYMCFLTSDYLTERVSPERVGFNISETVEGMFADDEISFDDIRKKVLEIIANYLDPYLVESKQTGVQRLSDFVTTKAPRYKPLLNRLNEIDKIVDPNISDKDLDMKLHTYLMEFEAELLADGHDLMIPDGIEDREEYSKRIDDYLSRASDLKRSDLANYVAHRRVILDLLGKAIIKDKDGKYSKEEVLHKLIMPMQQESEQIRFEDSNLWLLDERLAFHNYMASDKTLSSIPITGSSSTKEPDLLGLNVYDNPLLVSDSQSLPLASITVVEIKRPMRDDARAGEDKDPIEQALGYLDRIREGKVRTETGRQIPDSSDIPGFCYIICDITETIKKRCGLFNLRVTADKLGYFGYNDNYKAYIEVISFDRLHNMARERNKAFFDKLGLPTM